MPELNEKLGIDCLKIRSRALQKIFGQEESLAVLGCLQELLPENFARCLAPEVLSPGCGRRRIER